MLKHAPAPHDRIAGLVVGPADEAWDEARRPWNFAHDQRPAFVAFPETADDVIAIVEHARRHGARASRPARCGSRSPSPRPSTSWRRWPARRPTSA